MSDPTACWYCGGPHAENECLGALAERLKAAALAKDVAYRERNQCVAALARMAIGLGWPGGMGKHDPADQSWDADWRNLVGIDGPSGQMTWHSHDSDLPMFDGIPAAGALEWAYVWDGHTTPQKYERLRSASILASQLRAAL